MIKNRKGEADEAGHDIVALVSIAAVLFNINLFIGPEAALAVLPLSVLGMFARTGGGR